MNRNWYLRMWTTVFFAVLSIYLLTPTFLNFGAKRQAIESAGGSIPWTLKIFPEKQIKLGLDLQGGLHLVLGVNVEKFVQTQVGVLGSDLREYLEKKSIAVEKAEVLKDKSALHLVLKNDAQHPMDLKKFADVRQDIRTRYPFLHVTPDAEGFGVELNYKSEELKTLRRSAVDQALKVMRNRIDQFGINEPSITAQGEDRILVQLPGVKDASRAKELIGRTAQLSFMIVDDHAGILAPLLTDPKLLPEGVKVDYERLEGKVANEVLEQPFLIGEDRKSLETFLAGKIPETHVVFLHEMVNPQTLNKLYRTYVLKAEAALTGDLLEDARVQFDPQWNRPEVALKFNVRGADIFKRVTEEYLKQRLAIVLDNNVVSAPTISSVIPDGRGVITLGSGPTSDQNTITKQAQDLAIVLRAGSLKAPIEILEDRTIGPTLGADSIRQGAISVLIAAGLVVLFMVIYYRKSGLAADLALTLNALFILASMVISQATLTFPGIAGLVLTLGMAVDANVIINERIREELRAGKDISQAIRAGYDRAFWTVFDSNLTIALVGFVLLQFGTGPVKGFAVTLLVGIVFSFFTSVYATRLFFDYWANRKDLKTLSI